MQARQCCPWDRNTALPGRLIETDTLNEYSLIDQINEAEGSEIEQANKTIADSPSARQEAGLLCISVLWLTRGARSPSA